MSATDDTARDEKQGFQIFRYEGAPDLMAAGCMTIGSYTPTAAEGSSSTASSIACTRSGVGGMSGRPSPQPRSSAKARNSSASEGTAWVSEESVPRMGFVELLIC